MDKIFELSPDVYAEIVYLDQYAIGSKLFRTIIELRTSSPKEQAGKLIKIYEIWATAEAIEDRMRLNKFPTRIEIENFVVKILKGRYHDEKGVPSEDGVYFPSASEADILYGNPRTFPYKIPEKNKPKLVKTTVQLPVETLKWLKNYGVERNVGLGEAIRRAVSNFQAGTVSAENLHK